MLMQWVLLLYAYSTQGFATVLCPSDLPGAVCQHLQSLVPPAVSVELRALPALQDSEGFSISCTSNVTLVSAGGRRGLIFGFYALLKRVGYGFVHPLHVIRPQDTIRWCINFSDAPSNSGRHGTPLLGAVRGSHYHTQHPLELTNFLNGFGPDASYDSDTAWATGLPAWTSYLQWLVANGQNFVEWCLLEGEAWSKFSMSTARQCRLRRAVNMAHDWGLRVSIDAPLNLAQQHAWRLQPSHGNLTERLDWLLELGVDSVSTEVGTTEFTHGSPNDTVQLINSIVDKLAQLGKELIVKNHASTGQRAKGFQDPLQPGSDINFNFLTFYADKRVVNAPHTVQMYSLTDPLMGSYSRSNYSDMHAMMRLFQSSGRPALYFPETAYWVDFDVTVPLFLPLYGANRLADIKRLQREMPDIGHLNFESGWPIGSWLSNTVQAVATWSSAENLGFQDILSRVLAPLPNASALVKIVVALTETQNQTLVFDSFQGHAGEPQTLMAYMAGNEGMNEAQDVWNVVVVQPKRTHPRDVDPGWFKATLEPRLQHLIDATTPLASHCQALQEGFGTDDVREKLVRDLCAGVQVFALRAKQVHGVYTAAAAHKSGDKTGFEDGLSQSQAAMVSAAQILASIDLDANATRWTGIARPTAYPFGYLWAAKSLFFWRRDHQIVAHSVTDPCYLNLYDPIEVGLAEGGADIWKYLAKYGKHIFDHMPWLRKWSGCMSGPKGDPPPLDPLGVANSVQPNSQTALVI